MNILNSCFAAIYLHSIICGWPLSHPKLRPHFCCVMSTVEEYLGTEDNLKPTLQVWDVQLTCHLMPCFTFIVWEKWISMHRDENPMGDMIRTRTVESPAISFPSPPIIPPPLSCAFSPLPYPSTPGVAQSLSQVPAVEAGWCSDTQGSPTCSTQQAMPSAPAAACPQLLSVCPSIHQMAFQGLYFNPPFNG